MTLPVDIATERQVEYIRDLMDKKRLTACPTFFDRVNAMDAGEYEEYVVTLKRQMPTVSRTRASEIIDSLKALPNGPAATTATDTYPSHQQVDAGRYAVEHDGTLKFYRVDKPTEGRWAGYTFVKVQASEDYHPVKGGYKHEVLELIARDQQAAMQRYGQELGSCGNCGRTLTDEYSRECGIGPVCRGRLGM